MRANPAEIGRGVDSVAPRDPTKTTRGPSTAARPDPAPRAPAPTGETPTSLSIGYPWRGHLVDGVPLDETRFVRFFTSYRSRKRFYGTGELVGLIERAAEGVATAFPVEAALTVGDLSQEGGGRVVGHRSHRNGRDVDVGFYFLGSDHRPAYPGEMIRVGRDGHACRAGVDFLFDDARNWKLVEYLLRDRQVEVANIFVDDILRERLLAEGSRQGANPALLERARRAMMEPGTVGNPHRDHFHVRVFCSPGARGACRDRGRPENGAAAFDGG